MEVNNKKVAALTLGCKVNTYDTEAILELFIEKGYTIVEFPEFADIYIINTCTVTNLGDKKSRQMLRKARLNNKEAIVVAAGCYAQVSPEEVSKIEGINLVIGTKDRKNIVELIETYKISEGTKNVVGNIMKEKEFESLALSTLKNRTRAYLKIQEGCDKFCSYCIIPYARGPVRSRNPKDILDEILRLSQNGFKEIVLAGIHVSSYGKDLKGTNLIEILKLVHDVDGIERIRLSSIEPGFINEDSVKAIKNLPQICNHFHLSLQSGCNRTLKNMNRKYSSEDYEAAVNLIRENFPEVALTTDVIVGFPGETEEDFMESYNFCKKINLTKIHVFQFSPKNGTKAAEMEGKIEKHIKEIRSKQMIALSEALNRNYINQFLGKTVDVLFETSKENNIYEGHTTNYINVNIQCEKNVINKILPVKLIQCDNSIMFGSLTNPL